MTIRNQQDDSVVVYQSKDGIVRLDVQLSDETVWLTQQQMMLLFETTKQNVSLHINNIFREGELDRISVVKDCLTTAADGKNYHVLYYNLDVIISVGYRVKSKRGTQFRQWANKVLKDYLLRGYSINQRLAQIENKIEVQGQKLAEHDQKIDFYADTYTYNDTHSTSYNYNNGNPYINFTVDGNASSQHDLLVSECKQVSFAETQGNVSLLFTHACAIPHFTVQLTDAISSQYGGKLTVKSIVLKNVNNVGNYYYATKSWDELSGSASYTLNNSSIDVTTAKQSLSSGYLFMIPQTRAADGANGTHLEITYTKGNVDKQAIIPLDIDWKAGTIHPINILLGTAVIE